MPRYSADWMTLADERILEAFYEVEVGTPTEISKADYVTVSPSQISRRCKVLMEYGLLKRHGRGVYSLTDLGVDYLQGDLDASELEPVDEEANA